MRVAYRHELHQNPAGALLYQLILQQPWRAVQQRIHQGERMDSAAVRQHEAVNQAALDFLQSRRCLPPTYYVPEAGIGCMAWPMSAARFPQTHPARPFARVGRPVGLLSREELDRKLENTGLRVEANAFLIHNRRGVSTLIFLALRRLLGARADRPIRWLLSLFAQLGRLPNRGFTACFIAAPCPQATL